MLMLAVDLCPDLPRTHPQDSEYRVKTNSNGDDGKFYDLMRVEIDDWLTDSTGNTGGRVAALAASVRIQREQLLPHFRRQQILNLQVGANQQQFLSPVAHVEVERGR